MRIAEKPLLPAGGFYGHISSRIRGFMIFGFFWERVGKATLPSRTGELQAKGLR